MPRLRIGCSGWNYQTWRGRDVYAYFNNDPDAVSTRDATRLRDLTFTAAGLERCHDGASHEGVRDEGAQSA
jgi:uncharacterized protein YecE (DUF72 family)